MVHSWLSWNVYKSSRKWFNNQETDCSCRRSRPPAATPSGTPSRPNAPDAAGVLRHQTSDLTFQQNPVRAAPVGLAVAGAVLHQDPGVHLLPEDGRQHRHREGHRWSVPGGMNSFSFPEIKLVPIFVRPLKLPELFAQEMLSSYRPNPIKKLDF